MAQALASAGADIAIAARTLPEQEAAADLIRKTGREVLVVPTDVSKVEDVRAMVQKAANHFNRLTSWSTRRRSIIASRRTISPKRSGTG